MLKFFAIFLITTTFLNAKSCKECHIKEAKSCEKSIHTTLSKAIISLEKLGGYR